MHHAQDEDTKRRSSRQRQVILDELRRLPCHPTADELYLRVRERLPNVSLGTVYRNLELLSSLGVVRRLDDCGGPRRFDGDITEHAHIRCAVCGQLGDLRVTPGPDTVEEIQAATDYRVLDVRLACTGICPECQVEEPAGNHRGQEQDTV